MARISVGSMGRCRLALDGGADDDIVAVRAGNGALHEKEVLLGDDLYQAQVLHGPPLGPKVAGHALILPRPAGRRAHAGRADPAVKHRAVRRRASGNPEAFYNALETATLGAA